MGQWLTHSIVKHCNVQCLTVQQYCTHPYVNQQTLFIPPTCSHLTSSRRNVVWRNAFKRNILQTYIYVTLYDQKKYIYIYTVGSRFATVRFTTIHLYDPCPVRPITPHLRCVTVATRASFLHSVHLQLFSGVHVFLLFVSQCSSFKLIAIFPHPWRPSKRQKRSKNQNSWRHILSWCLLNHSLGFR